MLTAPGRLEKKRGLRVKGLTCEFRGDRKCSRRPACSGDQQFGCSYGGGNLGLIRPHGYLVNRVGAFLVLHCGDYVGDGAVVLTDHLAANKISGLVVF